MVDLSNNTTYYLYDSLNRLTTEQRVGTSAYTRIYSYNNVGNRLSMINGTTTVNYYYNNLNQLTSSTSEGAGTYYNYDADGNLTSENSLISPRWNYENQMISIGSPSYSDYFLYDSLGKRIRRIYQQSNATTFYFYDGINVLLERYNPYYGYPSTTSAVYTLAPGVIGEIISCRNNGTDLFYHYDPIGNVLFVSDTSGNINTDYGQDGFGNVYLTYGPTSTNSYHLTTKEQDPDIGLYYFSARWYDPSVGRFVSEDPVEFVNRYNYVNNNPIRFIDPNGLNVYLGNRGIHCYLWTDEYGGFGKFPEVWWDPISAGIIRYECPNSKPKGSNPLHPGNSCFEKCVNDSRTEDPGWFFPIGGNCGNWCANTIDKCEQKCGL